jgi:cytoskeletal protein CcmA (bactofilin family)
MAMFDIGKRGFSGNQETKGEEKDLLRDPDGFKGGVAQPPAVGMTRHRDAAIIGPSIHIEGTLRGEEDLVIEGRVSGTVKLQGHCLTVGTHGQISANIYAHTVVVDGTVEGDLFGAERVVIKKSANITGNITSPRVSLEEGARFKGSIEMDAQAVEASMGLQKSKSSAQGPAKAHTETAAPANASSSSAGEKAGEPDKSASSGKVGGSVG